MFKKGNIVRLITEDGKGEILSVVEDTTEDEEAGNELIRCEGSAGVVLRYYHDELELVTEEITKQESNPQVANVTAMDVFALHDELNKYIVSIIDALRRQGCEDKISIRIECDHYSGDEAAITFGVMIKYGEIVKSSNLGQSADIAWFRMQESKRLEVKAIPFYVDDSP